MTLRKYTVVRGKHQCEGAIPEEKGGFIRGIRVVKRW